MKNNRLNILALLHLMFVIASVVVMLLADHNDYKYDKMSSYNLTLKKETIGDIERSYYVDSDGVMVQASDLKYMYVDRTFDDKGRVVQEEFFDEEGAYAYQYGDYCIVHFFYTESTKTYKYLDQSGELVKRPDNYSIVVRTHFPGEMKNHIDRYYDIDMNPVRTTSGYYAVKRIYEDNGVLYTFYLDENDEPCSVGKGWYGTRYDGEMSRHIDRDGNEIVTIDGILRNYPIIVLIVAMLACVFFMFAPKWMRIPALILYLLFIFYETIFFRVQGDVGFRLIPFWSYAKFFSDQTIRMGIINNIWLFVPYGAGVASVIRSKRVQYWSLLLPLLIEVSQAVFRIGLCETDDVINNALGAVIGMYVVNRVMRRREARRRSLDVIRMI